MTDKLREAAQALIDCWDTHPDLPTMMVTTRERWDALRAALEEPPRYGSPPSDRVRSVYDLGYAQGVEDATAAMERNTERLAPAPEAPGCGCGCGQTRCAVCKCPPDRHDPSCGCEHHVPCQRCIGMGPKARTDCVACGGTGLAPKGTT